ncbi:hypothetical protein [Haloglomus halophilum]|uniref:hypothetical protein n=1 Tax=Haloglomus halophilum TaxID=2962672 RepID=UPI0020C9F7B1|nr:hypothetical protein [Haloglomus halophilum]
MAEELASLRELVERLGPGDYLAWQAEGGKDTERTRPKTVRNIDTEGEVYRVEAKGAGNAEGRGDYHFTVNRNGTCEAYYHDGDTTEELGELVYAELTDTDDLVTIKRGWYDSRRGDN